MPALRTEITEIVTGLGMLGIESLNVALDARPAEMVNVTAQDFDRLARARASGQYGTGNRHQRRTARSPLESRTDAQGFRDSAVCGWARRGAVEPRQVQRRARGQGLPGYPPRPDTRILPT